MNQLAHHSAVKRNAPLEEAFHAFNEMSQNLTNAYQLLQQQVAVLSRELAKAHTDKVRYLSEKEQLADQLEVLLEVLPGAVIVLDEDLLVTRVNACARDWLPSKLIGTEWLQLQNTYLYDSETDANEFVIRLPQVVDNEVSRTDRVVTYSKTELANQKGYIVLLTDITQQREQHHQFEHKKKLAAMGKVSASLAHQIRTPLASALLYASQLGANTVNGDKRAAFTKKLLQSLRHLNSQVSDMLGYAHLGQYQKKVIKTSELVEQIELFYVDGARYKDIEIHNKQDALEINVSKEALIGAVTNLIDNAFDASLENSESVICELTKNNKGFLEISVMDQGVGITEVQQEKLFEPFYTNKVNGTGLGLAVVSEIAKAHGGQVSCQSQSLKGSTFTMTLPVVVSAKSKANHEGV